MRHTGIILPVLISIIWPQSASVCRISSKSEHPPRKDNVISISQDGGPGPAQYYFPFTICWYHCLQKVYQQTKLRQHLNSPLRYNYLRFPKKNVRHIRILLPVSISTISPLSAGCSPSLYWISSKSKQPPRKYDVIFISQDVGHGRSILLPVSYFLTPPPSEGQNLSANGISSTYLNSRLRYNCFRLRKKQTSTIL